MSSASFATADPVELRAQIQGAGLKVTSPRVAVLAALAGRPHSDADTVFKLVAQELPTTSLQAVYG
ncbi:MAG: transcriptional repressor, partial [Aeromicrobium sp.]